MRAMVVNEICDLSSNPSPLSLVDLPVPSIASDEILIKVLVCGVCHTEIDEIEGRTPPSNFPMIPGHQVVGLVEKCGDEVTRFKEGDRVGVAWVFSACGKCEFCSRDEENLCPSFQATGRDANGGYAEYMRAKADFAYSIPEEFTSLEAAPLLCAGAIGYRSLKLTNLVDGQNLGLIGFGASGHLMLSLVKYAYPNTQIFVYARSASEREFAIELGANWAGDIGDYPPEPYHCMIDTTPAWKPVIEALKNLAPGGRLVINAIRKENADISYLLKLDYPHHLWMEKEIKTVANVTRADVKEFLDIAAKIPIKPEYQLFGLSEANNALMELTQRKIRGAKVLQVST
jgi:propanol-preferring alcohol dehydrogenase